MSKERLTDAELVSLERWAADDLRGNEQREVWLAVEEIRASRLTAEDREALGVFRRNLAWDSSGRGTLELYCELDADQVDRALAVLDRLLTHSTEQGGE